MFAGEAAIVSGSSGGGAELLEPRFSVVLQAESAAAPMISATRAAIVTLVNALTMQKIALKRQRRGVPSAPHRKRKYASVINEDRG
jgi:hypothetical protein